MSVTAIVGAQFGDEGKGKITDLLAQSADVVIRFQGGNNAGHTVVNQFGTFKLHLLPSGIFNPSALCVLGPGTVIDPTALVEEIKQVQSQGIDTSNLRISERAHLLLPWHVAADKSDERERGRKQIGTTGRGVGPAYADKVGRHGIQAYELLLENHFKARVASEAERKNKTLVAFGNEPLDPQVIIDQALEALEELRPYIVDTLPLVENALSKNLSILLEGQLGAMRDLDWGIYPYVTSSNPLAGYAAVGAGVPARYITRVIGVIKAYTTAVGEGAFPTEILGEEATKLRELGGEYGATTGRPRRVGWFDGVVARYANRINGFTELALTKVDVLDTYEEISIGTAYSTEDFPEEYARNTQLDAGAKARSVEMPPSKLLEYVKPVYETMPGWKVPTTSIRDWKDLPAKLVKYTNKLESLSGCRIGMLSLGPEREATIIERRSKSRKEA